MSLMNDLVRVFESGPDPIPRWIWQPIAQRESGLDPSSHNDPTKNGGTEDSRGLFQINIMANPSYAGLNLFDPIVNATIAKRDFLLPAYKEISWSSDPGAQAAYVWQHGIKPNWASVQKSGADVLLMNEARQIAGGKPSGVTPISNAEPPWWGNGNGTIPDTNEPSGFVKIGLWVGFAILLLVMFLGGFWALAKAFGVDQQVQAVVNQAKNAAGTVAKAAAL